VKSSSSPILVFGTRHHSKIWGTGQGLPYFSSFFLLALG